MGKWTISNGPDGGTLAEVEVTDGRVSIHFPPDDPVELTPDAADHLANVIKTAVGVARQD